MYSNKDARDGTTLTGKFSAGMPNFVRTLKSVDLPAIETEVVFYDRKMCATSALGVQCTDDIQRLNLYKNAQQIADQTCARMHYR